MLRGPAAFRAQPYYARRCGEELLADRPIVAGSVWSKPVRLLTTLAPMKA